MERRRQPIAHQPRELRNRIHLPDFVQHPEQQLLAVGLVAEEPAIEPQLDRTAEPQREAAAAQPEEIAARIADELRDREIAVADDGVGQHDDGSATASCNTRRASRYLSLAGPRPRYRGRDA